jgi:hypothetical protein
MRHEKIEHEIDQNFDFFQRNLSDYIPRFEGKFALLKNCAVVRFFDSAFEAEQAGEKEFSDGLYSIQQVSRAPADLGFFSYAFNQGQAR